MKYKKKRVKKEIQKMQMWVEITPELHERYVMLCSKLNESKQFITGRLIAVWVKNQENL
jgi:hypothetical protein